MNFTRNEFEAFRRDVKKALAEVEAKYGVEISPTSIKYTDYSFDLNLKVVDGTVEENEKREFGLNAPLHGFRAADYLVQFRIDGQLFELYGFSNNSPKNDCKIRNVLTHQTYKCSSRSIIRALGRG